MGKRNYGRGVGMWEGEVKGVVVEEVIEEEERGLGEEVGGLVGEMGEGGVEELLGVRKRGRVGIRVWVGKMGGGVGEVEGRKGEGDVVG